MQIHFYINISRPRWTRNWSLRRKVMVFLALALVLPPAAFVGASDIFSDVPDDHIFHDNISAISGARITTGTTPTTFNPEDPATRGQIAAFLHRGLPRVAYNSLRDLRLLPNEYQDSAVVTINTGGAPGGSGIVKLDATLEASVASPSQVRFIIAQDGGPESPFRIFDVHDTSFGAGYQASSLTWAVVVPTASTQTFRLKVQKVYGDTLVRATGQLTALYVPFGSTGGNTLDPPAMAPLAVSEAQESKAETNKSNK